MNLRAYLDSLRGKTVAVIGIGVSNTPLVKLLCREGISVTACDRRSRADLGELAGELEGAGAALQLGDGYLENLTQDVIFRTPGLRPDVPQLREAVARGSVLTSEMEEFFHVCPCPIIAVTGSDGKTTTTTIIAELLRAAGKTVHVGGNIGHPLLCEAGEMAQTDWAVLELSSFQLMTMDVSPHIAVMTNLAPNHLDVHRDMDEYVESKANIFCHQQPGDIAVFNLDNNITRGLGGECASQVRWFSRREEPAEGVFLRGESIICRRSGQEREVLRTTDIKIPGVHNVENYMAAIAAVDGLVPDEVIRRFAREFGGVEHRIELVRTYRGVKFYNDSIASSPSRTIAGLHALPKPPVIILGGHDKHIPFDTLGDEVCLHAKAAVVVGETAQRIASAIRASNFYDPGKLPLVEAPDFRAAVETAYGLAQPGDIVTLSPACSSFDLFKNFEERGNTFCAIVESLH